MISKKGQTEDFFTDIIPAVILIVIAIIVAVAVHKGDERSVALMILEDRDELAKLELLTVLRSEIDTVQVADMLADMEMYPESFIPDADTFDCADTFEDKFHGLLSPTYPGWSLKVEKRGAVVLECARRGLGAGSSRATSVSIFLPSVDGELTVSFWSDKS